MLIEFTRLHIHLYLLSPLGFYEQITAYHGKSSVMAIPASFNASNAALVIAAQLLTSICVTEIRYL